MTLMNSVYRYFILNKKQTFIPKINLLVRFIKAKNRLNAKICFLPISGDSYEEKTSCMPKISFLPLLFLELPTKQTFDMYFQRRPQIFLSFSSMNVLFRLITSYMRKVGFLPLLLLDKA